MLITAQSPQKGNRRYIQSIICFFSVKRLFFVLLVSCVLGLIGSHKNTVLKLEHNDSAATYFSSSWVNEASPHRQWSAENVAELVLLGLRHAQNLAPKERDQNAGLRLAFRFSKAEMGPVLGVQALSEALKLPTYAPLQKQVGIELSEFLPTKFRRSHGALLNEVQAGKFWVRIHENTGRLRVHLYEMRLQKDALGRWHVQSIQEASKNALRKTRYYSFSKVQKSIFPIQSCLTRNEKNRGAYGR